MILNNENQENLEKLGDQNPGDHVEIVGFCIEDDLQGFLHRLFEVGFLVGEKLEVMNQAPVSKDPISVKVKDATYAMRREDANLIRVRKLPSTA